jgi:20S proteasome alpha/beta subunit
MVTAGSTTFEMAGAKRLDLTPKIYAFSSGDASDSLFIGRRAKAKIAVADAQSVEQAAECYAEAYREFRLEVFERELLTPIGLTLAEYNAQQRDFDPQVVARIDRFLRDDFLPMSGRSFGGSTIIAGVDVVSGPIPGFISAHIYLITDPGQITCHDEIGFVAVGSGAAQAEAYLMSDSYSQFKTFNEATLAVYCAKRRAETAVGVGPSTDLMRIDNASTGFAAPENFENFERIYQKRLKAELKAKEQANKEIEKYMEALNAQSAAQTPTQAPPPGPPAADQGDGSGSP